MHVMFIHPNFPSQFGQAAFYLTTQMGWQCTYVTSVDTTALKLPFNHLNYRVYDKPHPKVFQNPENLQGLLDHVMAVYRGLRGLNQLRPDLVVGHMSYGTMLYLKTLYRCPFVGFFELLPPPFWSDELSYRKEFPVPEGVRLFNATYHTMTHLHQHMVDAVYTPTRFQMHTAPKEWHHKFKVIGDGVDTQFFQRRELPRPLEYRGIQIKPETRVVTYVSPGLESVRGFDIFMKMAKIIAREMPEAHFLIAGDERTVYGHELFHIGKQSFKQWVLSQDEYDLSRFHFLGIVPPDDLATLYSLSDAHIYLTVPHLVSGSLLQPWRRSAWWSARTRRRCRSSSSTGSTASWPISTTTRRWPSGRWRRCATRQPCGPWARRHAAAWWRSGTCANACTTWLRSSRVSRPGPATTSLPPWDRSSGSRNPEQSGIG